MGILSRIIRNYELLCRNDYVYRLSNGAEIKVVFQKSNLPHLLGLHKLIDIEDLRRLNEKSVAANVIYKKLKRGVITFEQISNSEHFYEIERRLEYISKLEHLLFDRVVLDFDPSKLKTKLTKVNILFYVKINDEYVHLPLVLNNTGYYAPNTLIVQNDRYYIENQNELNVESLTIMNRDRVIRTIRYEDTLERVA